MIDFEELKAELIKAAAAAGIEQYEIYYQLIRDASAETLGEELSGFSFGVSGGICFRCIMGGRMGYAATELMNSGEMRELVIRALENSKQIENDDEVFIYPGSPKYGQKTREADVFPDAALLKNNALALQRNTYAKSNYVADGTQSQVFAFETETRICNSMGLNLKNTAGATSGYTRAVVKVDGESADDYDFTLGCELDRLLPLSERAVAGALAKIGAGEIDSGKYDVIIDGRQMQSLLAAFSSVFSGKSARLGLSLLAGKEGCEVASPCITITDDPFDPNCPMQTTFDAEGVAVYTKNVIEKGVLKTLLYDLTNAKKAGVESTGNASKGNYASTVGISPFCFSIRPGEYSLEQLFEMVSDGLYVTEIKGLHAGANHATGDFSVECAGFLVEGGRRGRPIKSFTIAGNFYGLLRSITHVGNKVEYGIPTGFTVFASPAVLVRNISAAGK
ncbi:MAG: TldD/PmbA family protein [Eubacteriales bacterium]|jgi:PmbA protein